MKVLLADADRDLLISYEKLLTMDGHSVTTAFDGVQVMTHISQTDYDVAVIHDSLPRIGTEALQRELKSMNIPVILMLDRRVDVNRLLKSDLPAAYLPLPFLPEDLARLMNDIASNRQSQRHLTWGDADVDVSAFRFAGTSTSLTCQEIDLIGRLADGQRAGGRRDRTMIHALNEKLTRLNRRARIKYELEKGYALVNEHE